MSIVEGKANGLNFLLVARSSYPNKLLQHWTGYKYLFVDFEGHDFPRPHPINKKLSGEIVTVESLRPKKAISPELCARIRKRVQPRMVEITEPHPAHHWCLLQKFNGLFHCPNRASN